MKKKLNSILFAVAAVAVVGLSSCAGGYTCPTYMQNDDSSNQEVMVSVKSESSEIN